MTQRLAAALLLIAAAGCSDPAWRAKKAVRRERIRADLHLLAKRERESGPNLREIRELHRSSVEHHREHLSAMSGFVHRRVDKEFVDWRDTQDQRRSYIRQQLRGKPETIRDTWARMTY